MFIAHHLCGKGRCKLKVHVQRASVVFVRHCWVCSSYRLVGTARDDANQPRNHIGSHYYWLTVTGVVFTLRLVLVIGIREYPNEALDIRLWKSGSGYQALDIRLWKSGSGNQALDIRLWISGSGNQALEIRLWKSGSGNQALRVSSSPRPSPQAQHFSTLDECQARCFHSLAQCLFSGPPRCIFPGLNRSFNKMETSMLALSCNGNKVRFAQPLPIQVCALMEWAA